MTLNRHHLIYLVPEADVAINTIHENKKEMEQHVTAWISKGLPCIYAKQFPNVETVNLGLPLFYANKKHRVSLSVSPSALKNYQKLPQLIEMQDYFSSIHGIKELNNIITQQQINDIAVYGSFLFHYLSGQPFIEERSDLDLLIHYRDFSLMSLQKLVIELTSKFQRAIDGEVRFSLFGDIPIKELLNLSAKNLLCKSKDNIVLISRNQLYEYYPLL